MKRGLDFNFTGALFLALSLLLLHFPAIFAQDVIFKKTGEEIQAKVIEIGLNDVSYKKFDNQSGPTYKILQTEIRRIRYENGSEDMFDGTSGIPTVVSPTNEKPPAMPDVVEETSFKSRLEGGFNLLMHNGIYGGTVPARPKGGEYYPTGGDPYTGLGFGVNIDFRAMEFFSIHFDINNYSSTTPVAYSGGYATSDWVWEMNDYGSRDIGPFSENANYNINTTGMRLGLRIYPLKMKHFQPWYGIYYGYYNVNLGVYNDKKDKTYGNVNQDVTGLTYFNFGIDYWDKSKTFGATLFAEFGSPVIANYEIEDCLHTGWIFKDYGEGMHIFGYNRFGVSLNFASSRKK